MKTFKRITVSLLIISTLFLISSCSGSVKVDKIYEAQVVASESNEIYEYDLYKKYAVITRYNGKEETVEIPDELGKKKIAALGNYSFSCMIDFKSVTIPETVVLIGEYAFWNSGLESINIPKSVKAIGNSAFRNCLTLQSVTFEDNGVEKIESSAFEFCDGLTSVDLPEGLIEIGDKAFSGCSEIEKVTIPSTVTKIGSNAFSGNSKTVFIVNDNSYAEQFLSENGFSFVAS